jgi:hypothetical protein
MVLSGCNTDKVESVIINTDVVIIDSIKRSCTLTIGTETTTLPGKIRSRGGMSSKYSKRSFSLELDEKFNWATLPHDDDWIINANYIDKTFMRHKISYQLFREMGVNNIASKCKYVNLSLNEDYQGLYVLMEQINGGMVGLDKKDSLAMIFKDPAIFHQGRLSYSEDSLNYYHQKFPKIETVDNAYYLDELKQLLFESSGSTFQKNISHWFDIDNVIDWHILLLFSNNGDGIMKNFYLYKIDSSTPFRFAIWDYDHSFGRDGDNELNMMDRPLDCERSILLKRLLEWDSYRTRLRNKWLLLRKNNIISTEHFQSFVKANNEIIEQELPRNFEKWPLNSNWYYDTNNYQNEIEIMLKFVPLRIKQLDDYFSEMEIS